MRAVVGDSMGGHQAYGWAISHPDRVTKLLVAAAAASQRTSATRLLDLLADTLTVTPSKRALALHAKVWSVLGVTREVYSQEAWRSAFRLSEEFVETVFERDFAGLDPQNLLCQEKWRQTDCASDLPKIRAATVVMPLRGDVFAPVEQCLEEQRTIPGASGRVLESVWGHYAFAGLGDAHERDTIDRAIADLLSANATRPRRR